MIEINFLKKVKLIRQVNQKSVICHDWYFLDKRFKFQADVCNGCHDILMMSMKLSDIANLNIHGADYCCIISGISKSEAIKVMRNINLAEKRGAL